MKKVFLSTFIAISVLLMNYNAVFSQTNEYNCVWRGVEIGCDLVNEDCDNGWGADCASLTSDTCENNPHGCVVTSECMAEGRDCIEDEYICNHMFRTLSCPYGYVCVIIDDSCVIPPTPTDRPPDPNCEPDVGSCLWDWRECEHPSYVDYDYDCPPGDVCCVYVALPPTTNLCGVEMGDICRTEDECLPEGNIDLGQQDCPDGQICCDFDDSDCNDACENTEGYPEAHCGAWDHQPGCSRPDNPELLDCYIGGVYYDCYCCRGAVDTVDRPLLNPRCGNGINTAIGCIPLDNSTEFVGFLLRWGVGIGGGIALLLIIYAGFQIITSAGDPQKLQAGKELLTAAIAGLVMLIFSVFLLNLIGVNILSLPGF